MQVGSLTSSRSISCCYRSITTDTEITIPASIDQADSEPVPEELATQIANLKARRKARSNLVPLITFLALLVVTTICSFAGLFEKTDGWILLFCALITVVPAIVISLVLYKQDRSLMDRLCTYHNATAVGPLLNCVNLVNGRTPKSISTALTVLLPSIAEKDSSTIDTKAREILNSLIYNKSTEVALGAFHAIEIIGDGTALPYMGSIANGKGIPSAFKGNKAEAQFRARNAVEAIRGRIESQNRSNVLLRASQAPAAGPDQLLRSVIRNDRDQSDELLRPEHSSVPDGESHDLLN